jgi:hypothetical protein
MGKALLKSLSICLFASSLLAWFAFACAAPDQDTLNRMGEISTKLVELQQKLQACGSNVECQQKVSQEITALSQQYLALSQSGGQAQQQQGCPTCKGWFKPGWSCLPLKMSVTDRVDHKGYGSYPVGPGDWKWYVGDDCIFAYNAVGSGILTYTKSFEQFEIWIRCPPADCHITQFTWAKKSASYTGYTKQTWTSSSGPQGPVTGPNGCGFSVVYPPPVPSDPDSHYRFNELVARCDDEYGGANGTRVPYEGSPPFQMTPQTVKSMVDSRQFSKTFAWRLKTGAGKDDPSYEDHNLAIKIEVGEPPPPEKPGALAVTPGDGFSSNRPDPKKPFAPLSKTYTLKNTGDKPINYSVAKKVNWLNLDKTSGSLPPKGSATVTVSINVPVASKLLEDTYKDTVTFTNTTDGKGNTTRPADVTLGEEQTWQIFLTGNETDEMDPYWKITTKVNGAIRFDYKLRGEFTIFKKKGKWIYKNGTITIAEVGLSDLHEPVGVWMVKPLKCVNCDQVSNLKGQPLKGSVDGQTVELYWGKVMPKVNVEAKITCPCKPMPNCAQWGTRLFISEQFFQRVNWYPLTLKNGPAKPLRVQTPQGLRWVNAYFTLKRLK